MTSINPKLKAYLALAGGILALTVSPLFVRWADAPGMVTSFYRMLITSAILTPLALRHFRANGRPDWRLFIFPAAAGFFSSLDHALWGTAIQKTTVANATLLNNISPLWVGLFALVILKERLGLKFWIGLAAVLAGASAVLGGTISIRPEYALGDVLAIISSAFYAGFFLFTQKGRQRLDVLACLWATMVSAMVGLLLWTQLMGYPLVGYSTATYLTFLTAALISQLAGYFCITYALGHLPASIVTPTMVAQPVLTALAAIPIAGEALLGSQVLGGCITLVGIYLLNTAEKKA